MVYLMISATTQTLAELLVRDLPIIGKGQISFHHPQNHLVGCPGLNLYCYHIQANGKDSRSSSSLLSPSASATSMVNSPSCSIHTQSNTQLTSAQSQARESEWFDLSFLISATDYTTLGEQHLLSEVVMILSNYDYVPDEVVAPELRGLGLIPIRMFHPKWPDTLQLWNVLCAPLRPALQVNLTVPFVFSNTQDDR